MFVYELKLSQQACQLLFALIEYNETLQQRLANPKKGESAETIRTQVWHDFHQATRVMGMMKHFVSHADKLIAEGLIIHRGVKNPRNDNWTITEKGYIVIALLKIEFADLKKTLPRETQHKKLGRKVIRDAMIKQGVDICDL